MTDAAALAAFLDTAFQTLAHGVADRTHPARHPTLASVAPDGPQQRTVVLRGFDRDAATLEFHTDSATAKVSEFSADARAGVHIWVPSQQVQLRLSGRMELTSSDPVRWDNIPPEARTVYGGTPTPGTPIRDPEECAEAPDIARFTVLTCHLHRIEVLHLGADLHRRALYHRVGNGWDGTWIAP